MGAQFIIDKSFSSLPSRCFFRRRGIRQSAYRLQMVICWDKRCSTDRSHHQKCNELGNRQDVNFFLVIFFSLVLCPLWFKFCWAQSLHRYQNRRSLLSRLTIIILIIWIEWRDNGKSGWKEKPNFENSHPSHCDLLEFILLLYILIANHERRIATKFAERPIPRIA